MMTQIEVELLTDQGNNAVVRLPERKYPGVVVQGDTLSTWLTTVAEAIEALDRIEVGEAKAALQDLAAQLHDAQERYEAALRERGIELPY